MPNERNSSPRIRRRSAGNSNDQMNSGCEDAGIASRRRTTQQITPDFTAQPENSAMRILSSIGALMIIASCSYYHRHELSHYFGVDPLMAELGIRVFAWGLCFGLTVFMLIPYCICWVIYNRRINSLRSRLDEARNAKKAVLVKRLENFLRIYATLTPMDLVGGYMYVYCNKASDTIRAAISSLFALTTRGILSVFTSETAEVTMAAEGSPIVDKVTENRPSDNATPSTAATPAATCGNEGEMSLNPVAS